MLNHVLKNFCSGIHTLCKERVLLCRYGGQFAYVEIMNSMRQPGRFTSAVSFSTPVMSVAYLALGAIGYWSQGMGSPTVEVVASPVKRGPGRPRKEK